MQQKLWKKFKNAVLQDQRTARRAEVTIKILSYHMVNGTLLNYEDFQGRAISLMGNTGARGETPCPKY